MGKKIDKRETLQVVTDNSVIDAKDLPGLSLNARKLFYIAVSQCKKTDVEFYEFDMTPAELAEMWGIDRSNVYREADKITTELMKIVITLRSGKKSFEKKHLFETCKYNDDSILTFKLHKEMSDLLLGIKGDFSKPHLWDFMKMRSPYSMALWHLFQREMRVFRPMAGTSMEFGISLDELRQVTGCEKKFKQVGQFKQFVLDKALKEIKRNCWVDITYDNVKHGRTVIGLTFTAKSVWGAGIDVNDLPPRLQKRYRKAQLVRKSAEGKLTPDEDDELQELILELDQMTLEDWVNRYPVE